MRLNTVENARRALSGLIRKREKDDIEDVDYRALVYGLSQLLAYFKHIDDLRIDAELREIREQIETLHNRREAG